ncbi:zinc finger protein OZF-like [Onthophagus taurus]|uniref:zinc finger protein OZF-like n=1 Tax=Onthophagus taurus TaxID=166361 RepID=UPI000C200FC1|nr:gastrula zinc finger protein XlCGF26.1-like [Onthophagus taurus]
MEIKLLSCPLCLKPHFEGVDSLRSSLITAATSPISCPVCNELLMGLDKLTIHLFSHIQENFIKATTIQTIPSIVHSDHTPDFFSSNQLNILHTESQSETDKISKTKLIRCDICNFSFSDENILEMHQKLLHQTQADLQTGKYSYHCHLCSKKFKMRGSLMVHLRVAHFGFTNQQETAVINKSVEIENKLIQQPKIQEKDEKDVNSEKIEKSENKQWACDVCFKLFTTKYFLKKHKRLHTGEMPYFCTQCNKSFTFQQSYHKHMLYHSSEKPHVCGECGRAFKELSTLHNHERIHSGERPFACETCGKCFRQRVSYLVHRRIHTGVMPYKCTACDKSFRYKVSQKSHKCLANPPGSVIRAPILVDKIIQKANKVNNNEKSSSESVNSIVFNAQGEIIGQNFAYDGQNIIRVPPNNNNNENNNNQTVDNSYGGGENTDFFSMVLSPGLPDVQTLYLSSPEDQSEKKGNSLDTINEESFKKLLYGDHQ